MIFLAGFFTGIGVAILVTCWLLWKVYKMGDKND